MQLQVRLTRSTGCSRMDTSICCLARISSMTLYRQATDMQEELKVNFFGLQGDDGVAGRPSPDSTARSVMVRRLPHATWRRRDIFPEAHTALLHFCATRGKFFSCRCACSAHLPYSIKTLAYSAKIILRGELLLGNLGNLCHKHTNAFSVNVQARIRMQAGWGCLSTRNLRTWSCVTRGLSKWCQLLTCASKPPPPQVLYQLCP